MTRGTLFSYHRVGVAAMHNASRKPWCVLRFMRGGVGWSQIHNVPLT